MIIATKMEDANKISVIITGTTGMVGEGVLLECLHHPLIKSILIMNRRPSGFSHPKLKELIHADLSDITPLSGQVTGYQACFFCAGVSSVGMKEEEYSQVTYTLTLGFAETLARLNPDMTFEYISGSGTDRTEKGRIMWARVKGRTENDLMKLPFKAVYNFRPGYMHPTAGQKNIVSMYRYITWMYPFFRRFFPNQVSTMKEMGTAMINAALYGYGKPVLEVKDIVILANIADN